MSVHSGRRSEKLLLGRDARPAQLFCSVDVPSISMKIHDWLVVSNIFNFPEYIYIILYGIILPIDELILFKMVETTNQ